MSTPPQISLAEIKDEFLVHWKKKMRRGLVTALSAQEKAVADELIEWIYRQYHVTRNDNEH